MHGGGWIYGTIELDDLCLRVICAEFQIVFVNVDYRLAPEHPFPKPLSFIVCGTSAGATMAAVLAHRVRDDPYFEGRRLTGQLLQIPMTVHSNAYPENYKNELQSYTRLGDPRILDQHGMNGYYAKYGLPPFDPECSLLLYPSHHGLAPAYIQVCSADALRDEALLFEKVLREEGVKTKLDVYPGVGHAFWVHIPKSNMGLKLFQDFKDGLSWLMTGRA
ncbi:alpha/beta-hydrolase [Obba rivulosa]|uniref:Alpha/beta-hydrolase n=1 Tax=Obba rivulosa TaxID=1052685 RepID=A0A8E2B1A6_9APHY|nr:alpha/beta-hydrolase [Obba rivulosa]